jgi:hypothetical protein
MTCSCNHKITDNTITETMPDGFKRQIVFRNAYKCELTGPHSHGIAAMEMCFVLIGPLGATQWLISTGWYLENRTLHADRIIDAWDIGYHSPKPMYEGQTCMGHCSYLGCDCYYDGSGLNAEPHVEPFLEEGPGHIWKVLREEYNRRFVS